MLLVCRSIWVSVKDNDIITFILYLLINNSSAYEKNKQILEYKIYFIKNINLNFFDPLYSSHKKFVENNENYFKCPIRSWIRTDCHYPLPVESLKLGVWAYNSVMNIPIVFCHKKRNQRPKTVRNRSSLNTV